METRFLPSMRNAKASKSFPQCLDTGAGAKNPARTAYAQSGEITKQPKLLLRTELFRA
jgi:hypothetical protein